MVDIVKFLTDRYDELSQIAEKAAQNIDGELGTWIADADGETIRQPTASGAYEKIIWSDPDRIRAITTWQPKHVLADIGAKRGRLVEFCIWDAKLKEIGERPDIFSAGNRGEIQGMWMMARRAILWDASVYADHPDYDQTWTIDDH